MSSFQTNCKVNFKSWINFAMQYLIPVVFKVKIIFRVFSRPVQTLSLNQTCKLLKDNYCPARSRQYSLHLRVIWIIWINDDFTLSFTTMYHRSMGAACRSYHTRGTILLHHILKSKRKPEPFVVKQQHCLWMPKLGCQT